MKSEIMLYEYLYQLLLSQIYSGILRRGQKFPSQQELCRQYNVGITTARKVTRLLEENGFIETNIRKRPVVIYEVDNQTYVSVLLQRKRVIFDIFDGFQLLMPVLHLGGAMHLTEFEALESIISNINGHMNEQELYRHASHFLLELLTPYNNQIMYDLQTDSENFTNIPYLPVSGLDDSYSLDAGAVKDGLTGLLKSIRAKDYQTVSTKLNEFHCYGRVRAERYLNALKAGEGSAENQYKPQKFMLKNRAHLYTVIARLLYRRILSGEFDQSKYIPSIPDLMEEYSISQATAFSAVALLNDIGAVQTLDKKGTVIAAPGADVPSLRMDRISIGKNMILFLDALQILAVCSENLALGILSAMDKKTARASAEAWNRLEFHTSGVIVRTILTFFKDHTPHRCLCELLDQMDYLLIWGHYLERNRPTILSIDGRVAELFPPLCAALEQKEAKAFAGYVGDIFQMAYETTRELTISYGISEDRLPAAL